MYVCMYVMSLREPGSLCQGTFLHVHVCMHVKSYTTHKQMYKQPQAECHFNLFFVRFFITRTHKYIYCLQGQWPHTYHVQMYKQPHAECHFNLFFVRFFITRTHKYIYCLQGQWSHTYHIHMHKHL